MDNIRSQRKLGLLPEGADQRGAPLAAPELTARFPAQVRNILRTEVRQGVAFEMAPDVFGRVEFGRVSRQVGQYDLTARALHIVAHPATAMHGQAIPNDEQPPANLATQVPQKLHRLAAFDAAAKEAKVELPPGDASDDREQKLLRRSPMV